MTLLNSLFKNTKGELKTIVFLTSSSFINDKKKGC